MEKHDTDTLIQKGPVSETSYTSRDDEIGLIDLWLILRKRWVWVAGILLLSIAAAVAYITLTPPTYEAHAKIQVGKVHALGHIENTGVIVDRLIDHYGSKREIPYLKEASRVSDSPGVVSLITVGSTPQESHGYLMRILSELIQRHEVAYRNAITPLQQRLTTIEDLSVLLKKQIDHLDKLAEDHNDSQPLRGSVIALERSRFSSVINALEREELQLQQKLTGIHTYATKIVSDPALPEFSSTPRKTLSLALSIAFGLMMGILASFLLEFYQSARKRISVEIR